MKKYKLCFFVLFFSLLSCVKQSPQLPSNKGILIDENVTSMLMINQKLALREDSVLYQFVRNDKSFKKSELGFWYKIHHTSSNAFIKDKDKCKFSYQLTFLDGKLVDQSEIQLVVGQKQIVVGLEEGLKLISKGDSATFIIPWYLGFGMTGDKKNVPPYKSLIYIIKVNK